AARSHAGLLDMGKLLGASAATDKRARGGRGTSAADLKFLHRVPRIHLRNFKSKSGTRIIELLVPFGFRSSYSSVPRCITNFENRALASAMTSPTARLVGNGVHFDLGVDHRPCLDGGACQHGIPEVLAKYPIIAPEVAGIFEIGRDAHDIGQGRSLFRENSTNSLDRAPRLFLDRSRDHVALGILGHLPGDEDEVTGANGRMKRQIRVLLSDRIYVLFRAARVVHVSDLIRMPWFQ